MSKISSSPDRYTFQKEGYVKRCEKEGKLPNPAYIKMYETWREQEAEEIVDPEWQKDNMEYDLRSTKWICDKVKASENYAQNLYAAMCNMQFQKLDVVPILKINAGHALGVVLVVLLPICVNKVIISIGTVQVSVVEIQDTD